MLNVAYRAHAINEIRRMADEIALASTSNIPVVGVVAPGPPGIGKTQATLELLADDARGRLVGPTHEQARERRLEATKLLRDTNRTHLLPRHIQGLGRKCLFLTEDKWASKAWSFGDVACDQCPSKKQCPGIQQHWQQTDIYLGVHSMGSWTKPGLLTIDELPDPVDTRVFTSMELAKIGVGSWHPTLDGWRRAFHTLWNQVLSDIEELAATYPDPKMWGTTVQLSNLFPPGSDRRADLDALCDYFHNFPTPAPPADEVRKGTIQPEKWIAADLEFFVKTIRWESDGVPVEERADFGLPYTACLRVYGDSKGRYVDYQIEMRSRWSPPNESHLILDSTAPMSREVYSKLYRNFDIRESFATVPLPTELEGLELVNYPTLAFARSRSLSIAGHMLKPGTHARVRALREIIYKVRRERQSQYDKVRVGIIDHKAVLEALGYDFHNNAVLTGPLTGRQHLAGDELLEETLSELESIAELVVGYHGGVIGSNLFKNVRILAVHGDPTGHIGMLAEEARTLDMSSSSYIRWRVSMNAIQEIFRGRLLDADVAAKKTVYYFGKYAPDLSSMSRSWVEKRWPDGGRLLSKAAHAFTGAIWEQVGTNNPIILGTLLPEFAAMHATRIGDALYALRAAGESWDASSPRTRELYRRTANAVADDLGLHTFDVAHPLGGRRPVPVHASTRMDADAAMNEVQEYLLSLPSWRKKDVEQLSERAEEQRVNDVILVQEVNEVRAEVTRLKTEYRQQQQQLETRHWMQQSRLDLGVPAEQLIAATQDAWLTSTLSALRTSYRAEIQVQLSRWRRVKMLYKEPQALVLTRDEVLKFSYRGIAF